MRSLYNSYFSIRRSLLDKNGQSMVEYIIIVAFIGLMLVTIISQAGSALLIKLNKIKEMI